MLFAHWEAIGEYNVFFEMDKGSTDKATMHLPASYDPYKGVQVKQGGFVAVDQAPTFSQNDIQQAAGYFLSYWSYIIEHRNGRYHRREEDRHHGQDHLLGSLRT